MSKTYIAYLQERYIEKRPDGEEWLQMPVNVSGHELMIKTVIPLTPYTDLDMEQVRNEAYEDGYKTAKVQCNIQAEKDLREVGERHYQKGLSDAWDAAKKIVLSREDGGLFEYDTRKAVFGCGNYMALKKYSASEAIEKIRQYEQEKEEIKVKVGDEVQNRNHSGIKAIVLEKDDDVITAIAVTNALCSKVGDMYINRDAKYWKKTGKHYEIAEVLKKIHEEKE